MKKNLLLVLAFVFSVSYVFSQNIVDFEELVLEPESNYVGADGATYFESKFLKFYNSYTDWGGGMFSWDGFAYTNETDTETYYFTNLSAASGKGVNNSQNYALAYVSNDWENNYEPIPTIIKIDRESGINEIPGMYVSLTAYTSLYMSENDFFKNEKHWYKLKIIALNSDSGFESQAEIILADYRAENADINFKLTDWTYIDLSWINTADSLLFYVYSSDTGDYGLNLPSYFCLDNIGDVCPENTESLQAEIKTDYFVNAGESVELNAFVKGGVQPYSFIWDNDELLNDNSVQSPIATVNENTAINLTITDAKGNFLSETVNIWLNTSNITENIGFNPQINIFENNILNIKSENNIKSVEIFDISGKVLLSKILNSKNEDFDISQFKQGLYIIKLSDGSSIFSNKILKK